MADQDPKKPGAEPAAKADPKAAPADPKAATDGIDMKTLEAVAALLARQNQMAGKPAARIEGADSTVPGGKYVVDGQHVNAWGAPFQEGRDPANDNPAAPQLPR